MGDAVRPSVQTPSVLPDWELLPIEPAIQEAGLKPRHETEPSAMIGLQSAGDLSSTATVASSDQAFVAAPFDPDAEAQAQHLKDRLQLLKVRSATVGAVGIVGLGWGLWTLGYFSPALVDAGSTLWSAPQAVHIPSSLFTERDAGKDQTAVVLQLTFLVVGFFGLALMRREGLEGIKRSLWMGLMVLTSVFLLYINLDGWRGRNAIEAVVAQQDWGRLDKLLVEFPANLPRHYVQAQAAKVAGDDVRLRQTVATLLRDLDDFVEQTRVPAGGEPSPSLSARLRSVRGLDAKVIHDLDVAVNRTPRSEVGIAFARGAIPSNQQEGTLAPMLLSVVLVSLATVVGAIALLRLWFRMEARVRRITPWVESPFQPYR